MDTFDPAYSFNMFRLDDAVTDEVDFVVKLGGSAITVKDVNETLKLDALCSAADVLARCFAEGLRFIVAHGAGSFGHIMGKQYGVHTGFKSKPASVHPRIKYGFSIVRQSVTKLNLKVVEILVSRGIPAVSCSPCGVWTCDNGRVVRDGCDDVRRILSEGFVPVLHGDCVLDNATGCSLLSSDTILKVFSRKLNIKRAIFVMDCDGLYTAPPNTPGAQLIPALCVDEAGRLSSLFENDRPKSDATGGISLKLDCAIDIVRGNNGNVKVFLCSLNNNAFIDACLHGALQGNSRCTVINFQQTDSVCG